jgi:hypothetical protein
MKESMKAPKERPLTHLERVSVEVEWSLPSNLTERVAPGLLLLMFKIHDLAHSWAKS